MKQYTSWCTYVTPLRSAYSSTYSLDHVNIWNSNIFMIAFFILNYMSVRLCEKLLWKDQNFMYFARKKVRKCKPQKWVCPWKPSYKYLLVLGIITRGVLHNFDEHEEMLKLIIEVYVIINSMNEPQVTSKVKLSSKNLNHLLAVFGLSRLPINMLLKGQRFFYNT